MSDAQQDTSNAIALPPFIYLGFLAVGLAADFTLPYPLLPNAIQLPLGAVVIVAGLVIIPFAFVRFRAAGTSVDVRQPTTAIITGGAYRFSRNPIYLAMTLVIAGIAIALDGIWVMAMLAPTLLVMHYGVIAREERYLEAKFGDEYLDYKRSVRRWI